MKNTIKDYPVQMYWDERAEYYVAEILEIPTSAADGTTATEAYANLEETFAVLKKAYQEEKLPFPASNSRLPVSVAELTTASQLVKVAQIAKRAGIPVQTLATKVKRGTEFSVGESHKIARALSDYGVMIHPSGSFRSDAAVREGSSPYHFDPSIAPVKSGKVSPRKSDRPGSIRTKATKASATKK